MLTDEDLLMGHPLRVLRSRLDLSQRELAAKVGVSEATITRAENGHRISPKVRRLICDRLGKTSEELGLFGRTREVIYPKPLPQVMQEQTPSPQTNSLQAVAMQPQTQQTTYSHHVPALIMRQSQETQAHVEQ